jgi:sulfite exporter TauE/SafE
MAPDPSPVPHLSEALALGFASGSACLASCGAPLLPWLTGLRRGWLGTLRLLGIFLSGRLAGYLVFGLAVGAAGRLLDLKGPAGLVAGGASALAMAALLGFQAWRGLRTRCPAARGGALARFGAWGLALLGLLTGLNLCGPFVGAALRAAQAGSVAGSAAFFAVFFLGTAVWMLPLAVAGAFRRFPPLAVVSRLVLVVLAVYYACSGTVLLSARWLHA